MKTSDENRSDKIILENMNIMITKPFEIKIEEIY